MLNAHPDLLNGLSEADAARVLALGRKMVLGNGAELFHMGQEAESLYVIMRGHMKLTLPMQVRGQEGNVLVEERTAGQTVGWSALIPPYRFTLTATAAVDSEILAISREALRGLFAAAPEIGAKVSLNLATVVGGRLQVFQAMWVREMQRVVELRCA
ncbi:MAG: cyclic nucleotide-binding domain-containing protein [Acidobacteria bacterium]|nr:cyclic nucleotide-binding domain-containing protein [Acidobacteriota bacterium]